MDTKRFLITSVAGCLVACAQTHDATVAPPENEPLYRVRQASGPGSFFLIGGGDDEAPLLRRFITLSGGNDAPIVVVPLAGGETQGQEALAALTGQGAKAVLVLDDSAVAQASDITAIQAAGGLYFTGGEPGLLLSSFPTYLDAARTAWQAGCAIGGTSAGAMVWGSRTVVTGESVDALAHGVDASAGGLDVESGFGLLAATTVDPHLTQRGRFDRLWLAATNSHTLGIGIDEESAAEIDADGTLTAYGGGAVTLIQPDTTGSARVAVITPGHPTPLQPWQVSTSP